MIDWLLNILYNVGMFIGAIIALIGVAIYLSGNAERSNPNVANQRMLHELRKLNHLQREQIELEKTKRTKKNPAQAALDSFKEQRKQAREEHSRRMAQHTQAEARLDKYLAELDQEMEREREMQTSKVVYADVADDPEFWQSLAALKAEHAANGETELVAKMEADEAQLFASNPEIKAKRDAALARAAISTSAVPPQRRSMPPPLPPIS